MQNSSSISFQDTVAPLLEMSAHKLGAHSFSINGEFYPLDAAMDAVSPLIRALVLHANVISNLLHPTDTITAATALPLVSVLNEDAPAGAEVVLRQAMIPFSTAVFYVDSALEHAVCLGMQSLGYTPSEWDALPDDQKAIPIEPYLEDLAQNWVSEAFENGSIADQVLVWPKLLDRETLENAMTNNPTQELSNVIRSPSQR